ncbi:MAG: NAD(P)-dependent oxidoreductase, partial [Candidatus Binatia bacterium]
MDAFLPWDETAIAGIRDSERQILLGEVTSFLTGQIRALPRRLQLLFIVGVFGFATLVRLRHPLGLRAQPRGRRVAIVEKWAFGRFALGRSLFRLIRSTALLAFYDHPRVANALGVGETKAARSPERVEIRRSAVSTERAEMLVIGSGAGGAVTAHELARRGRSVLIAEEGARHGAADYGSSPPEAMKKLYRRRGMMPIMGSIPIGYVEGCCVGGSTEINSGFWHRVPPETLLRWQAQYDLDESAVANLAPHFEWAEGVLGVGPHPEAWPPGTKILARGAERMDWTAEEVPRMAQGCRSTNACASGCPTGAKQGMSRSIVPRAEASGARLLERCRVRRLLTERGRVTGAIAEVRRPDGTVEVVRIGAEHVIVCAGPTETPVLLRRSGVRRHIGDTLRIHPMLKLVARFPEVIDAHRTVLPLIQVKEFAPEITLGGAFFTAGHAAMVLSENWNSTRSAMEDVRRLGTYYVAVRGAGTGRVRASRLDGSTIISHELYDEDVWNLSKGLARLALLLLAAGAEELFPAVWGLPSIRSERDAVRWLDDRLPRGALALTTVHAFSS